MKIISKTIPNIFLAISLFSFSLESNSAENSPSLQNFKELSYGEIYLSQPERIVKGHTDISITYGAGLGVPQYKLHTIKVAAEHWMSQNWWLGGNYEYNIADKSSLQKNIEQLLNQLGNGISYEHPTMALRFSAGLVPFSGLVNLLGEKILPYEFSIFLEAGVVEYKSETSPGPYIVKREKIWHGTSYGIGLDQRILLYKNNGIKLGLNQYFERSFNGKSSDQRSSITIGWYGRF